MILLKEQKDGFLSMLLDKLGARLITQMADYTNVFSPNDFKKNDDIILKNFMNNI